MLEFKPYGCRKRFGQKKFALLKPWLRNAHINELWKTDYPGANFSA